MKLSEEAVNEAAMFVRLHVNSLLSMFHDVALGKNSKLFFKVAVCLWLITLVGGWTDFLTLGYTSKFMFSECFTSLLSSLKHCPIYWGGVN